MSPRKPTGSQTNAAPEERLFTGQEIGEFLLHACHDLRTSLRAIRAHAQLLGKGSDLSLASGGQPHLGFIVEGAGKIDQLVDELSSYSIALQIGPGPFGFTPLGVLLRTVLARLDKELRDNQAGRIEWAKGLGLTQMLVASLDGPRHATMDDVKRAADEYNKIGEKAAAAGIVQGLHNEDFECTTVDGKRTYDLLFKLLDPKCVKFQFQVSTVAQGFNAVDYLKKYPGRFISMHVQGWDAKTKKIAAVGKDTLDWKAIFAAAKVGGIKNYFVEMDLPLMKASVPYLKSLEVA